MKRPLLVSLLAVLLAFALPLLFYVPDDHLPPEQSAPPEDSASPQPSKASRGRPGNPLRRCWMRAVPCG